MSYLPNNQRTLFCQTTDKTVANTASETSLIDGGVGSLVIQANTFKVGDTIRLTLLGYHSGVSNPTIRVRVKTNSTVQLDTGAVGSANSTNELVRLNALLTVRSIGASGSIIGHGYYQELGAGIGNFPMVNTAAVTIDTTIDQVLDITVEWGTASASNTITSTNVLIEILRPIA